MKTLADLRRAMVVGVVVQVVNHVHPNLSGERTVVRARTKSWCLSLPVDHPRYGTVDGAWFDFPSAAMCRFDGDSVTIHRDPEWNDGGPFMTITLAVPGTGV